MWSSDRPLTPPRANASLNARSPGGLLDGDDGAALVDVDKRHAEPRALLKRLDVASAVGVDVRQPDREEAVGDLGGKGQAPGAVRQKAPQTGLTLTLHGVVFEISVPALPGTIEGTLYRVRNAGSWVRRAYGTSRSDCWRFRPPYSPHAAKASLNARSPGGPFSMAMMARRWLT